MDIIGPDCAKIIYDYVAQLEHVEKNKAVLADINSNFIYIWSRRMVWCRLGDTFKLFETRPFREADEYFNNYDHNDSLSYNPAMLIIPKV